MGELRLTCPATGRDIDTGITTDADTLRRIKSCRVRVFCPHCHKTHSARLKAAYLDDAA